MGAEQPGLVAPLFEVPECDFPFCRLWGFTPMNHSQCSSTVALNGSKSQSRQNGFGETESKGTLAHRSAALNSLSAFT